MWKMNKGFEERTSDMLPAPPTAGPHLVEGAFSNVHRTQNTDCGQSPHNKPPNKEELTIFFSFSPAPVHPPRRDTAYIPITSAATPTINLLISLVLHSIELGESLAERAPVRSESGSPSAAVKSRVERPGSSKAFGSET